MDPERRQSVGFPQPTLPRCAPLGFAILQRRGRRSSSGGQRRSAPFRWAKFETIGCKQFQIEHVPEPVLRAQFDDATDSLQRSFAALMLGYAYGDGMNMSHIVEKFGITLSNVDTYARRVLGNAAAV